jgi:hypothetical protein
MALRAVLGWGAFLPTTCEVHFGTINLQAQELPFVSVQEKYNFKNSKNCTLEDNILPFYHSSSFSRSEDLYD